MFVAFDSAGVLLAFAGLGFAVDGLGFCFVFLDLASLRCVLLGVGLICFACCVGY